VVVAGGRFFALDPDGGYSSWNGAVETLTPFVAGHTLTSNNQFTLLDGTLSEASSYLYFAAYSVEGEPRLLFTPNPAQLVVKVSTTIPDETNSPAGMTFDAEAEDSIVQTRCIGVQVGAINRKGCICLGISHHTQLTRSRKIELPWMNNYPVPVYEICYPRTK
jgi:hypothetical protein